MQHVKHFNRWSGPPPDKAAVQAPPDVIAADTAMEELTERPALPASAEDEAAGWDWDETNIDEFEEE